MFYVNNYTELISTIQNATFKDIIYLNPGTYVISNAISFLGKAITIKGLEGSKNTFVECGFQNAFVFNNFESSDSVLEGVTIRGCLNRTAINMNQEIGVVLRDIVFENIGKDVLTF